MNPVEVALPHDADPSSEAPAGRGALAGLAQLAGFLAAGARAVVEFFFPGRLRREEEEQEEIEPEAKAPASLEDVVEDIGRKIAPFPGQEG